MKPLLPPHLPKRPLFTLIEMISAIAIMGLVISITVVGVKFAFYINSDRKSRAMFKQLEIAFDQYFADNHCYPSLPENLKSKGYVPMGVETMIVESTSTSQDGTTMTETRTETAAVTWIYQTPTGPVTVPNTSFFRATLNRPPNNYTPYIEGALCIDDPLHPENIDNYTKDGFGQTIYYRAPGLINTSAYDLWSAGSDGYFGDPTLSTATNTLNVYGTSTATPQVHIPGGDPDDYVNWRKN